MWIRSQDKRKLINVHTIGLCNDDTEIWGFETSLMLGKYSTKEKALKVLDMIQEHIDYNSNFGVFQMPQDDEVVGE